MPPSWASTWTASGPLVERPTARRSRRWKRNLEAPPPLPPSPPSSPAHPLSTGSEDQPADIAARSALHDGHLRRRQQPLVIIPTTYSNLDGGPTSGTVVGIVLGSVFGFLLLLWLIYTCVNMGGGGAVYEEDMVVQDRRSRSSRNSRSTPPRPRSRSPIRTESRVEERVIVEERRATHSPDDEIVEVIEEDEPPRRERPSRNRPHSGYRSVDPERYAGGNLPMEEVYSKRSSRRERG